MSHELLSATLRRAATALLCVFLALPASAQVATSQRQAAEQYLAAVAAADTRAMAMAIHEQELTLLRQGLLDELRLEADRDGSLVRTRLFGAGTSLAQLERLTPQGFFAQLAARLHVHGRQFDRVDWLGVVQDSGGMVHVVGRLRPAKQGGSVRVPVLVSLVPWGKDWKAALPLELQAQIDDLRSGRVPAPAAPAAPAAQVDVPTPAATASPPGIVELFEAAEENLEAGRCEAYYQRQMSPNFRRTLAPKALRTLIGSCESREETRRMLLSTLHLARTATPRFEYAGTRAVYDLRGKGLPFAELVVEQVGERWYIAE